MRRRINRIAMSASNQSTSPQVDEHFTMDNLSNRERSALMSRVRAKDTWPELTVRSLLHNLGYRFRLHTRTLPGTPDIVLARHRIIVFVHGCFWHSHGCRGGRRVPGSNTVYWEHKLALNKTRDRRNRIRLYRMGWRVLVIWECQTKNTVALKNELLTFIGDRSRRQSERLQSLRLERIRS